jgi:hypothetical protein
MKITPDDPALTAFVLGELNEVEAAAVDHAVKNDEDLLKEKDTLSSLSELLSNTLGTGSLSLGEKRIAEIHKAGQRPDSDVLVLDHRKRSRRQSFLAVAGVAAVVVTGFVALSQFDVDQPGGTVVGEGAGSNGGAGSPDGATPAGGSKDLPGEVKISSAEGVTVPLGISKADPSFVERALLESGRLPARDQFKVADWVNLGVVDFEPLLEMGELEGYFESGACPWDATKLLWMIHLRSPNGREISPSSKLVFDPERVASARLVGGMGAEETVAPNSGKFNSSQIFLYELEVKESEGQLGSFSVSLEGGPIGSTNEGENGYVPIYGSDRIEEEASSAGFRTAVVLGGFARWAASESRDKETLVRLSREAREILALEEVTDESCRYALDMILQSEETLRRNSGG